MPHALVFLLLLLAGGVRACTNVTSLSQSLDTLLAEYDRESAPARPVRVRASFDLRHAALLRDSTVHALADLTLIWQDPHLGWNASMWGCDSVIVSADRLWRPDVDLANSAGGGEEAALTARLTSSGVVTWTIRYDVFVPIAVDLTAWPSDQQTAVFKFGSREHTYEELDLDVIKGENPQIFETGAWELLSISESRSWRGAQRVAVFTANLRRRAAAHDAATSAVLAAAVLLLLAAAALPPLSRPPLCACASFLSTIWLVTALVRLPMSSTTPAGVAALGAACAAGGAAGAAAALVALLARRSSQPPRALKTLASTLSALCRLAPIEDTSSSATTGAWAALAALLDYALLGALLITIFVVLCIYL